MTLLITAKVFTIGYLASFIFLLWVRQGLKGKIWISDNIPSKLGIVILPLFWFPFILIIILDLVGLRIVSEFFLGVAGFQKWGHVCVENNL